MFTPHFKSVAREKLVLKVLSLAQAVLIFSYQHGHICITYYRNTYGRKTERLKGNEDNS